MRFACMLENRRAKEPNAAYVVQEILEAGFCITGPVTDHSSGSCLHAQQRDHAPGRLAKFRRAVEEMELLNFRT